MSFRTHTTRQALATLGACFALLLLLASPASAVPDGYQPQLSSQGPDAADRYLAIHRAQEERQQPAPLREQPDGFQPQLRGVDSAPVASPGFDWETTGFVAGGILAAMLLALMSAIALRERRGLRSA